MKKLINAPHSVVPELLDGLVRAHPGLALLEDETVVIAPDVRGQVALVSGGGAGHEPAHAGYVGPGMLTAAVVGDVFTSPSTDAVLDTIRAVAGPEGVLLIVKSYTGDRLNFGLAAELARAEGIAVETVIVADDVALARTDDNAGRRGLAGTVFVHKIAGAAAAAGLSLTQVRDEAQAAADSVGTMGVALSPCTVPAAGQPGFALQDDEIELGLGIHGEAGVRRTSIAPADKIIRTLIDSVVADRNISPGDRVALLVNNLGGTPAMEIDIVTRAALKVLADQGVVVERAWRGSFLTALEMAGCSVSLLPVDDALLARLDAPTTAPAWPAPWLGRVQNKTPFVRKTRTSSDTSGTPGDNGLGSRVEAVCAALVAAEPRLTELDRIVGDGDLGISLARGAEAVRKEFGDYGGGSDAEVLRGLSRTLGHALGGTSGPLYAVLLLRTAAALDEGSAWPEAFSAGVAAVSGLGGAEQGDRTMLDALIPAAEAMVGKSDFVAAAREGAAATAAMLPRRGRSSYLGERAVGTPDPGAEAVVVWLEALVQAS